VGRATLLLLAVGCGPGDEGTDAGADCEAIDRPAPCPARGLYDGPVEVVIGRSVPNQVVHYTLDGTTPTTDSPIWDGEPIEIAPDISRGGVRSLRMIGDSEGRISAESTHTYVFAAAVLDQPADPPDLPAVWGFGDNTRESDYAMDPTALGGTGDEAIDAVASLPILAITCADAEWWDSGTGIYMQPDRVGPDWERPMQIELFNHGDSPGFAIRAGVKIQGNSSTEDWKSAKLSLRVALRAVYGAGKLRYPLFASSPVDEFENLILDSHYNNTWHHFEPAERDRAQYIRDQFTARLQNEVGSLAPRSLPVHLFLNGLYWGLYDLHERPDAHFAAAHLGGDASEWDVLRHSQNIVVDGTNTDYVALITAVRSADLSNDVEVDEISALIDIDDLIDYMLVNHYVGNVDWDHHNWYAIRRSTTGDGFRFVSWDAERVLEDVDQNSVVTVNPGAPSEIFSALLANDGFRAQLDARATELLGDGGVFAATNAAAIYTEMTEAIRGAVLLESARWGDNRRAGDPYLREGWDAERQSLLDTYFPARTATARSQIPAP
jgi:hypothetical protein